MRKHCIGELPVRKASQHRRLYDSHDFTGGSADHGEAEDAIVVLTDKNFHKALPLARRLRSQHRIHGQSGDPHNDVLAFRVAFAQPDASRELIDVVYPVADLVVPFDTNPKAGNAVTQEKELMARIAKNVAPATWDSAGGPGHMN